MEVLVVQLFHTSLKVAHSKYAEDIFGELYLQAGSFAIRVNTLGERIDRLQVKVTQLDPKEEEVSLQGINTKKAFKSDITQDQQLFVRQSLSAPVQDTYSICDTPPPLNNLSCYRDDGKEALKFYTDPSYFFDLWKEKMLQDTKDIMKEKRKHRREKKDNPNRGNLNPRKIKTRKEEWERLKMGKEFVEPKNLIGGPGQLTDAMYQNGSISSGEGFDMSPSFPSPTAYDSGSPVPPMSLDDSLPPPPPDFSYPVDTRRGSGSSGTKRSSLVSPSHPPPAPPISSPAAGRPGFAPPAAPPPPPPTPGGLPPLIPSTPPPPPTPVYSSQTQSGFGGTFPGIAPPLTPPPPPSPVDISPIPPPPMPTSGGPPPPPPPPPPPAMGVPGMPPPPPPVTQPTPQKSQSSLPPVSDARSDLLAAIRQGFNLRKVEEQQEQEKRDHLGNDVATILSRRIAVEYSDSEDGSSEFDEEDWSD
ncbi:wiskott-Aldrich syndrome protein family member 2 [Protopterus annectens]|uniref:wiskott-Aldrich syndrome protein family member 2 n=1 Tax=Protopterus annectens TaxID=7888 RepID=UPI001CFA4CDD|nr:wiskott-Aldrich syndrome protein family member 2 [Protopterus annectens]